MPPSRSELSEKEKWNVEALYPHPQAWSEEFAQVKGGANTPRWPELGGYRGKLSNPAALAEFMEKYLFLDRKLTKLATYAHMRLDEDLGNDEFKRNYGLISSINNDFRMETAWIDPEILSLSEEQVSRLMSDPAIAPYKFALEKILRTRPHILPPDKEELMARSAKALDSCYKAFAALSNADMTFKPAADASGREHPLTNGTYLSLVTSHDRELRKTAFNNLMEGYRSHLNTLCELIQGQVMAHEFNAKARSFPNCVTAALFTNQIDPLVISRLIEAVKKGRPQMEEYLRLRKQAMKLSELHAYDLMPSLVQGEKRKVTYEEACERVIASVAPLGQAYQQALQRGLIEDRWVDPYENARKRSGAYSSGCYDSMPYILLNFHGRMEDMTTLAHEAGHSMHTYLSCKNQPYVYSQYPIFVAEVASTFNELLLLDELFKRAKTKEEKAVLINDQIDRIRATIFRQTLFAEFELKIHEIVERGEPLTPALLDQIYGSLISEYYGSELVVDDALRSEWARIPHFYYNFYVYQYATGLSAAMALHAQATRSVEARDRYLQFLSSGGSKYPLDLLKDAGVDMKSTQPIEAAIARFEKLVRELKELLPPTAEQGKHY